MKKLLIFLLCLLINSFAQIPTNHSKLLYEHLLTYNDVSEFGKLIMNDGEFTDEGWFVSTSSSQLRIEFNDPLPSEATLSVTMKNMLPLIDDDWVPLALYSRGEGAFSAVNDSPGSFVMLKTDPILREVDPKYEFKFLSSYFYGASKNDSYRIETRVPLRTWDIYSDYVFSLVWTPEYIWCKINDDIIAQHEFTGQIEEFLFLYLGKDNTYNDAMYGVIYSDLHIRVPEQKLTFRNIARARGGIMADQQLGAQGAVIANFNGDNKPDIYSSHFKSSGHHIPNKLFFQDENFTEQENANQAGDDSFTFQSLAADFDRDGDMDIFTMNFHKDGAYADNPNYFFFNDGSGHFSNQTASVCPTNPKADSKGCTLIDLKNDGDLDVIVANSQDAHQIYENDGNGHFSITDYGLENIRISSERYRGVSSADLNSDGIQELIFVTDSHIQIAGWNGSRFEATKSIQLQNGLKSCTVSDLDNEGNLDLLVCMVDGDNSRIAILYNNGGFQFSQPIVVEDVAFESYGVVDGDFDNDGDFDLYAIQRYGQAFIYLNDGNNHFIRAAQTNAECYPADGRGSAVADFNNDGKLDILVTASGGELDHEGTILPYSRNHLFLNESETGNHFLQVKICDDHNQESGIGSHIGVFDTQTQKLLGYRQVLPVNGYKSGSSLTQHFGLGVHPQANVFIHLPNGEQRLLPNVDADQKLCVHLDEFNIETTADTLEFEENELIELNAQLSTTQGDPIINEPAVFTLYTFSDTLQNYTKLSDKNGQVRFTINPDLPQYFASISSGGQTEHIYLIKQSTLAVELLSFTANFTADHGVRLHWETISESDNLGFHIFRKEEQENDFVRINEKMIPSTSAHDFHYSFIDASAVTEKDYVYQLADIDRSGVTTTHKPIRISTQQPYAFNLAQNHPNPFNGHTRINFELKKEAEIRLTVYNLRGQKLITLADGHYAKGKHSVLFNGKLENGIELASGIYLYKLSSKDFSCTRKLLFAK